MKEFDGHVRKFIETTKGGGYGFIEYEAGGPRLGSIFFAGEYVVPDAVGRIFDGKKVGSLVSFELAQVGRNLQAKKVTPLIRRPIQDAEKHREVSTVDRVLPVREPTVILRRKTGETIRLVLPDVVEEFKPRWATLEVGNKVYHGVRDDSGRWVACAAQICAPGELAK